MPSRRGVFAGVALAAAAGGGALVLSHRGEPAVQDVRGLEHFAAAPPAAAAHAMGRVAFSDDFVTVDVDSSSTGAAGHSWYTDLPFGWGRVSPTEYSVSDSVLRITPAVDRANWTLATASASTGAGHTFGHGYFEARIRFPARDIQTSRLAWPAFWALSADHVFGKPRATWAELDVVEAHGPSGSGYELLGSVHEWTKTSHFQNSGNATVTALEVDQWVRYGCLWTQGSVRWFIEDREVLSQQFGARTLPTPHIANAPAGVLSGIDEEKLVLVVGTGAGWPMEVDWVRVWE